MKKSLNVFLFAIILLNGKGFAQTNSSCSTALPICDGNFEFTIPDYGGNEVYKDGYPYKGTLVNVYSPTWWYFKIEKGGALNLDVSMRLKVESGVGAYKDVDLIVYGPFSDVNSVCASSLTQPNVATGYVYDRTDNKEQSYFSSRAIEHVNIENAEEGKYYIILISNYLNPECRVTFSIVPHVEYYSTGDNPVKLFESTTEAEITCNFFSVDKTSCNAATNQYDLLINGLTELKGANYTLTDGPSGKNLSGQIPASGTFNYTLSGLIADGALHTVNLNIDAVGPATSPISLTKTYTAPNPCSSPCAECVPSFSPEKGQKYLLSAWVKEGFVGIPPATYLNSNILLTFDNVLTTGLTCKPTGPIIDGWQRIETSFTVPGTASNIQIQLNNLSTTGTDNYFDDIRIHPFKSNMKSFVYDPSTQRLVAELDENNYATKYEYDDEGILIRVKKETERGVMTIKESRNNQSKISAQ